MAPKSQYPETPEDRYYDTAPVAPTKAPVDANAKPEGWLFDVTCIVGSVYQGADSHHTPEEVAFLMIANSGNNGEFHFPDAQTGEDIVVGVQRPRPQ